MVMKWLGLALTATLRTFDGNGVAGKIRRKVRANDGSTTKAENESCSAPAKQNRRERSCARINNRRIPLTKSHKWLMASHNRVLLTFDI